LLALRLANLLLNCLEKALFEDELWPKSNNRLVVSMFPNTSLKSLKTRILSAAEKSLLALVQHRESPSFQETLGIQIDITNACNLACLHCYHAHHNNQGAIGLEDWKSILLEYKDLLSKLKRAPDVVICGGEPLLCPHLVPLLQFVEQQLESPNITILTNGTLIRPETLSRFSPWVLNFQVSLDGPEETSHDSVRGKGSFQKALKGISQLQNAGHRVTVLSILSKRTALELRKFFQLAADLQISEMNFVRLVPEGSGQKLVESKADDTLYGLELKAALENIVSYSNEFGVTTNTSKALFHLINPSLGSHYRFQGLVVDYKGNLKVSSRSSPIIGNVLESGLENLYLNSPLLKALRTSQIEGCGECPHLSRCGGDRNVAYAATGSFLARDPGCWLD
jgi:AdoMet-dependent heme synthase